MLNSDFHDQYMKSCERPDGNDVRFIMESEDKKVEDPDVVDPEDH